MKRVFFGLGIAFLLLVLLSGCTAPAVPNCGNGTVEFSEQCDESDCPEGQLCEQCRCKTITPPALPD